MYVGFFQNDKVCVKISKNSRYNFDEKIEITRTDNCLSICHAISVSGNEEQTGLIFNSDKLK